MEMDRLVGLSQTDMQKRPRDSEFQYDAAGSRPGKVGRPAASLDSMAGVGGDDSVSATADLLLGNSGSSGSTLGGGGLFSNFTSAAPAWNTPMNFMTELAPPPLPAPPQLPSSAPSEGSLVLSHSHVLTNPSGSCLSLGQTDRNGDGITIGAVGGPHSMMKRPPPNFAVPILESSRVVKLPPPPLKKVPLQLVGADKNTGASVGGGGKAGGTTSGRRDKDRQNGAGLGSKPPPENGAGDICSKDKMAGDKGKATGLEAGKSPSGAPKERQVAEGFRPPARPGRRGRPPGSGRKQAAGKAGASTTGGGSAATAGASSLPDSPPASSYEPDPIGVPGSGTSERRRSHHKKNTETDAQIGQLAGENIRLWEALTKTVGELAMQRDMLWRLQAEVLALRVRLDAVSTSPYSWGGPPFIGQGPTSAPPGGTSGGTAWLRPEMQSLKTMGMAGGPGGNTGPSAGEGITPETLGRDGTKAMGRTDLPTSSVKNGASAAAFSAVAVSVDHNYSLEDRGNLAQGNAGMPNHGPASIDGLQNDPGRKTIKKVQKPRGSEMPDRVTGAGGSTVGGPRNDVLGAQAGAAATAEAFCNDGGRTESDALEQSCLGGGTGSEITGVECAAAEELVCDEGQMFEKKDGVSRSEGCRQCRGLEERGMAERHMLEVESNNPSHAQFQEDREARHNCLPGVWSKENENAARLVQSLQTNTSTRDRAASQLGLELGMNKVGVEAQVDMSGEQHNGDRMVEDSKQEDNGNRCDERGRDVIHVDGRDLQGVESDGMVELPRELFGSEKDGRTLPNERHVGGGIGETDDEGHHGDEDEDDEDDEDDEGDEDDEDNRELGSDDKESEHDTVHIEAGLEFPPNFSQGRDVQEADDQMERGSNILQFKMQGPLGGVSSRAVMAGQGEASSGFPTGVSTDNSQQMDRGGRTITTETFSGLFSWNK